jgi:hypothetical protein
VSIRAVNPLAAILPRVELRRWPWRVEMHPTIGGEELFYIHEHVPERDSGEPIVLGGLGYGRPPVEDEAALVDFVYRQLQRHVLHELAEAFYFDGVRRYDPHAGEMTQAQMDELMQVAGEKS